MRRRWSVALAVFAGLGVAPSLASDATQDWAFPPFAAGPSEGASAAPARPDTAPVHLPGSTLGFTRGQLGDMQHAVDWFPDSHPPAPAVVMSSSEHSAACGFCHLVQGGGRPENAALAGLPSDYIRRQIAAFASGGRTGLRPNWAPTANMAHIAKATDPAAAAQAAGWFAAQRFSPNVAVVERATIPPVVASHFTYKPIEGPPEPLGLRIVETPVDWTGFELRDPRARFVAYVPLGAVGRGRVLVASGGPAHQPCAMCHGPALEGALGPPLAGRSPGYLARQLMAFRAGRRATPEAEAMRAVAGPLTDAQIIDLAAYLARKPRA